MKATAIIPVKRFRAAKQRLVELVGPQGRAALVKAMLADVLEQVTASGLVERIIVVTGEGRAEKVALHRAQRAKTPIEVFQDPHDAGHSEAATLGIIRAIALKAHAVALLPGDCPLLDASELDAALTRLAPETVAVVPDRHGTGTNALLMCPPDAIGPAFGPGSCERHVERAHRRELDAVVDPIPSLGLDLDTPEDLVALREALSEHPERAPQTAAALAHIPADP